MRLTHPIEPLYDSSSRVLILGSFPSVKSREQGFFYGHRQNRFWRVLAEVYGSGTPQTIEEKKEFLLSKGIALWDVIAACDITGSADSSIKNVVPNDISAILDGCNIRQIFVNGKTAERLYIKYLLPQTGRSSVCLPSTSPANARITLEQLVEEWKRVALCNESNRE